MHVGLEQYLTVSFLLFALGLLGVIMRRNLLRSEERRVGKECQ